VIKKKLAGVRFAIFPSKLCPFVRVTSTLTILGIGSERPCCPRPATVASVDRSEFSYTSFYCEENVWHLAGDPRIGGDSRRVVFISNRDRACALWCQRAGSPVLWDYHVILASKVGGRALIWDLDTTLDFPAPAELYLASTFPISGRIDPRFEPRFRVVSAGELRARFASDRSHMLIRGRYRAPPPAWPPIRTEAETMNLDRWVDMDQPWAGEVVALDALVEVLSR
jgi:hypothetical protein